MNRAVCVRNEPPEVPINDNSNKRDSPVGKHVPSKPLQGQVKGRFVSGGLASKLHDGHTQTVIFFGRQIREGG